MHAVAVILILVLLSACVTKPQKQRQLTCSGDPAGMIADAFGLCPKR